MMIKRQGRTLKDQLESDGGSLPKRLTNPLRKCNVAKLFDEVPRYCGRHCCL